jgi:peptidoglycan hydrolase-like protein with peptidoglycan-binding domain
MAPNLPANHPRVQAPLHDAGFFPPAPTSTFGIATLRSVVSFQRSAFGPTSGDGIVGPMTAGALGMDEWPDVD